MRKTPLLKINSFSVFLLSLSSWLLLKTKGIKIALVLLLILFGCKIQAKVETTCKHASMLIKTVQKYHIQPRAIDTAFSESVFTQFIEFLDPYGICFTKNDLNKLNEYKYDLGEIILSQNSSFLELSINLYSKGITYSDSLLSTFNEKEFTFTEHDSLLILDSTVYYNIEDLEERWKQIIKLQVLSSYFSQSDSLDSLIIPSDKTLASLKLKAIQREKCRLKSKMDYNGGLDQYVSSCYLKSIALAFDPHTNYYSQSEETVFTNMISEEVNSFGMEYTRNDYGEIEVRSIIPGSPAWKSNVINEGDVILKTIALGEEKEFECVLLREVVQYFTNEKLEKAEFFIRKKNGEVLSTILKKDKVDVQDNIIQSFILEGEFRIGYIYLPAFYTQTAADEYQSNGCANDVATEIIKLKRENIEGLIIDLRDNGGGSMMEAILMSGIFVDYGAVGIRQDQDAPPSTLKDMNRGTIYNNEMAILINTFSASASEFFAAAMQDQNRAVIVGNSSFGKSTFQQILPIDAYKYDNLGASNSDSEAYVKLTRGGFYRVTGKTHQKNGVVPDVFLPTIYSKLEYGENVYKSAIDLNKIEKKTYYYPSKPLPIEKLRKASEKRVAEDSIFAIVKDINDEMSKKKGDDTHSIPLGIESYYSYRKWYEEIGEPDKHHNTFTLKNPKYLQGISSVHNSELEINELVMDAISKDAYVEETFNIIKDLINLK